MTPEELADVVAELAGLQLQLHDALRERDEAVHQRDVAHRALIVMAGQRDLARAGARWWRQVAEDYSYPREVP